MVGLLEDKAAELWRMREGSLIPQYSAGDGAQKTGRKRGPVADAIDALERMEESALRCLRGWDDLPDFVRGEGYGYLLPEPTKPQEAVAETVDEPESVPHCAVCVHPLIQQINVLAMTKGYGAAALEQWTDERGSRIPRRTLGRHLLHLAGGAA